MISVNGALRLGWGSCACVLGASALGCSSDPSTSGQGPGTGYDAGPLWGAGGFGAPGAGGFGAPAGGFVGTGGAVPTTCGNGAIDPGEMCEPGNVNGQTCATVTMNAMATGTLICSAACQFNTTGCTGIAGAGGGSGAAGGPGTGGIGGMGGTPSGAGGTPGTGTAPSNLPTHRDPCPTIRTGSVTFRGLAVQVWAGPATATGGPAVLYWHGTGSSAQEAVTGLGQGAINEVTSGGGVIASFNTSTASGTNTGNNVWYTGDFDVADEIVACAIEQLGVDPRRIHAAGYSAGGLQTGTMSFLRSGYLASVGVYSGGALVTAPDQNPAHAPDTICAHGAPGSDMLILDFARGCTDLLASVKGRGGFTVDCNDGGGHISGARFIGTAMWQFFKDHPYGVSPKPYAGGLPPGYPGHCSVY